MKNYVEWLHENSFANKNGNIGNLYGLLDTKCFILKTSHYTKRGSKWVEISTEEKPVTAQNYLNVINAIPFFRNLGGYERMEKGYCYYGYMPLAVHSISPSRTEKTLYKFKAIK